MGFKLFNNSNSEKCLRKPTKKYIALNFLKYISPYGIFQEKKNMKYIKKNGCNKS